MTVRINKPAINLREKLAELDKPSGIVGEQVLRSDTAEDAREALNLEEHLFENFESTGIQDNATSTQFTVSDTGVDVSGTVTADGLTVETGSGNTYPTASTFADNLVVSNKTALEPSGITIFSDNASQGNIFFGDEQDADNGRIVYDHNGNANTMSFCTNGAERARIDSLGNLLVGTTDSAPATNNVEGIALRNEGHINVSRASGIVGYFNRKTNDGTIISLHKDSSPVGSIGAGNSGTDLVIDATRYSNRAGVRFRDSGLTPRKNSTDVDGGVDLGSSGARFKDLYLSGGVYLGGTGAANKLDDYETGNFTPTTNSGTVTFSSANYVKVGDIVTIYINNIKFSDTTTSQTLRIESLPFAASGDSVGSVMAARVSPTEGFDSAYVGDGTGRIEFFADTSGGFTGTNRTSLTDGNSSLYIQVTYKAV